nr:hypothetical protein [Salinisphaera halophila]
MKYLVFLGSARDSTLPKPARLGLRVARACDRHIEARGDGHEIERIDPLDFDFGPASSRISPTADVTCPPPSSPWPNASTQRTATCW